MSRDDRREKARGEMEVNRSRVTEEWLRNIAWVYLSFELSSLESA